jgi:hypothetical protein
VDADGVLFASVQVLYQDLQETKILIESKDAQIAALEQKLEEMETLSARLAVVEKRVAQTASSPASATYTQTVYSQPANIRNEIQ